MVADLASAVSASDLEVDDGLLLRLVFRVQEPFSFDAVRSAKRLLFSRLVVVCVENDSPAKNPLFFSNAHNGFGYER